MVGKGGSEVGDVDRWVKGAQLIEKEVERHRFVGDEGMDAWSDEGLDRDGGRAMANDDGSVLRVVRPANGGSSGSGHHVGGSDDWCHATS